MVALRLDPDQLHVDRLFGAADLKGAIYEVEFPLQPYDSTWWLPYYFGLLASIMFFMLLAYAMSMNCIKRRLFNCTGAEYTIRTAALTLANEAPTVDNLEPRQKKKQHMAWERLMDRYVELKQLGVWFAGPYE